MWLRSDDAAEDGKITEIATQHLDLPLLSFMHAYASGLSRCAIIAYFGHHPDAYKSAKAIARELRRPERTVIAELEHLVLVGLLDAVDEPAGRTYCLTPDPYLRKLVNRFRHLRIRASAERATDGCQPLHHTNGNGHHPG